MILDNLKGYGSVSEERIIDLMKKSGIKEISKGSISNFILNNQHALLGIRGISKKKIDMWVGILSVEVKEEDLTSESNLFNYIFTKIGLRHFTAKVFRAIVAEHGLTFMDELLEYPEMFKNYRNYMEWHRALREKEYEVKQYKRLWKLCEVGVPAKKLDKLFELKDVDLLYNNIYCLVQLGAKIWDIDRFVDNNNMIVSGREDACIFVTMKKQMGFGNTVVQRWVLFNDLMKFIPDRNKREASINNCEFLIELDGGKYYSTSSYYDAAKTILSHREEAIEPSDVTIDVSSKLNEEQAKAVKMALLNNISIIDGGPGTGKTFCIGHIHEMGGDVTMRVLAPTGKAVARVKETLKGSHSNIKFSTIHKYIRCIPNLGSAKKILRGEYSFDSCDEPEGISEPQSEHFSDIYVIDEFSMVDPILFSKFLKFLGKRKHYRHRIVLLGDNCQLASIQPGALLRDISNIFPKTTLTKVMRQDGGMLLENIGKVRKGLSCMGEDDTYEMKKFDVRELVLQAVTDKTRVITPARNRKFGECSTEILNKKIQKLKFGLVKPIPGKFYVGDCIMFNKNRDEYSNGEMGEIISLDNNCIVIKKQCGKIVTLETNREIELAYAVTVHKMQGSEELNIIVVASSALPWPLKTREIFYTAISRAKERVSVYGDHETVDRMIRNETLSDRKTILHKLSRCDANIF